MQWYERRSKQFDLFPIYYEFQSRHDDRLQMDAFSALATAGSFVGNSLVTGDFPTQRASNADFHVYLVWVHISWWSNSWPVISDYMMFMWRHSDAIFISFLPFHHDVHLHIGWFTCFLIFKDDKVYTTCVAS